MRGRIQNEDMPSANGQLYSGDEEDILPLRVMKEVLIKGCVMMIGNGQNVKPLIGSLGDEFFRRIAYAVERIVSRVKMKISLKGSHDFNFIVRFFNQFSGTFLKWIPTCFILVRIYRIGLTFL